MSYHSTKFGGHSHSGSGFIMILVWHVIYQDHAIKGSSNSMGEPFMVSHLPAKFGCNRHCDHGDKIFLVVEGQVFTSPCFSPPLLFISKANGMPCSCTQNFRTYAQWLAGVINEGYPIMVRYVYKINWRKLLKKLLIVCPENWMRRKRKKKTNGNCKAFCVWCKPKKSKLEWQLQNLLC